MRAGWLMTALAGTLAACSSDDGIDRDAVAYDGIGPEETISLTGTEPFWTIEIAPADRGYRATYSDPDNIDGKSFAVERFAGNNGLGFSGELDRAVVQIAVTPGDCSDGMSDRTYPFTATVGMGDRTLQGCAYTDAQKYEGEQTP